METEISKLSNRDKLVATYNTREAHQIIPFKYANSWESREVAENTRDWRIIDGQHEPKSVLVDTGKMGIVETNREVLTEGLFGCAALFIQGAKANYFVHMVSGNNPRNFGYWREHNFDPLPKTIENISGILLSAGENMEDLKAIIAAGGKSKGRKERLKELKEKLTQLGIKNVRIVESPAGNSVVYYSPDNPEEIRIIGAQDGPDGRSIVKHYDVKIEDEDIFEEAE